MNRLKFLTVNHTFAANSGGSIDICFGGKCDVDGYLEFNVVG